MSDSQGPSGPTRQSARLQSQNKGKSRELSPVPSDPGRDQDDSDSEEERIRSATRAATEHLTSENARLQSTIDQLLLQASAERSPGPEPIRPSIEEPRNIQRPPRDFLGGGSIPRPPMGRDSLEGSNTPELGRVKLTERTPAIDALSDGKEPTFRQWQASVTDRLEINADHYRSERARMALVWGHTSGTAKEYLEPQYLAEPGMNRFSNAEEMITLLQSFFVSGNERAEFRAAFHRLAMDRNETFPAFKARFISSAIKGNVQKSEWFFYLWEKVTPAIRVPSLGFKLNWDNSFDKMVAHFTAYDMERRNTPIGYHSDKVSNSSAHNSADASKRSSDRFPDRTRKTIGVVPRTVYTPADPPRPAYDPLRANNRSTPFVPRPPTKTPAPERHTTPGNCYNCGKPGHFANECTAPRVREINVEPEEETEEFVDAEEHDPDTNRMGNDDA